MLQTFRFLLKSSRPGLWFATIWIYILPTSQMSNVWSEPAFWFGLFYVTFPLNLMVYAWNDIVDFEADKANPRKDTYLFGAKGTKAQIDGLWKWIVLVQVLCTIPLYYFMGNYFLLLLLAFVVINGLYNLPGKGLRSIPPLELICQIGYLIILLLSIGLNQTAQLPWQSYLYLTFFAWQSHLIGEVMDIVPDRLVGKATTATVIGAFKTKLLIITLIAIEVGMLYFVFGDPFFAGLLALGLVWLLLDLFVIYGTKEYTLNQLKLFGYASNAMGLVSMSYVWYSGCLLQVA